MSCSRSLNNRLMADVEKEWWERPGGALFCTELQATVRNPDFIPVTTGK